MFDPITIGLVIKAAAVSEVRKMRELRLKILLEE